MESPFIIVAIGPTARRAATARSVVAGAAAAAGQSLQDPALPAAVVQGSRTARSAVEIFSDLLGDRDMVVVLHCGVSCLL
jgi:hypothetical protein